MITAEDTTARVVIAIYRIVLYTLFSTDIDYVSSYYLQTRFFAPLTIRLFCVLPRSGLERVEYERFYCT